MRFQTSDGWENVAGTGVDGYMFRFLLGPKFPSFLPVGFLFSFLTKCKAKKEKVTQEKSFSSSFLVLFPVPPFFLRRPHIVKKVLGKRKAG